MMTKKASKIKIKKSKTSHVFASFVHFAMFLAVIPFILALFVFVTDKEQSLTLPVVSNFLSKKVDASIPEYIIEIGESGIAKGSSFFNPEMVAKDVIIRDLQGGTLMRIPEVRADAGLLFAHNREGGKGTLDIQGARMFLWRDTDGRFNFKQLEGTANPTLSQSIGDSLDGFLQQPFIRNLSSVTFSNISMIYRDAKTSKEFNFSNGVLDASLEEGDISIAAGFELARKDQIPTLMRATLAREIGADISNLSVKFENADPVDLADQVVAFDWLRNLDAEVSSSFLMEIGNDQPVQSLTGVLDLGAGRLRETKENVGAKFDHAKAYYSYDANTDTFSFSNFELDTELGQAKGRASSVLERDIYGVVTGASFDAQLSSLNLTNSEIFEEDLEFVDMAAKMRVSLNPIHVEVEQVSTKINHSTISLNGDLWANDSAWNSKINLRIDEMTRDQLISSWPITAIPKTRKWVKENLKRASLLDFHGQFQRLYGDSTFDFKFAVEDGAAVVVKTVPPLHNAFGHGRLTEKVLTLELDKGQITTENEKALDMAGSRFHIPDITQRPATGEIQLDAKGDLESALQVLDSDKFRFIQKIGKSTDVASGAIDVSGWLNVPLKGGAQQNEIKFSIRGDIDNVKSEKLITDRVLEADKIHVTTSQDGMRLDGFATLDGVKTAFDWQQKFVDNPNKESFLLADLSIDQNALDALNIGLPDGSFKGKTQANLKVNLRPKTPATFELTSELRGAALQVPSLGWRKTSNSQGSLGIKGQLTDPPTIDNISLISNGLKTSGAVSLNDKGEFQAANFPSVRVGNWFSSAVSISGTGLNAVTRITGGSIDLRQLDIGASSGEKAGPLEIRLDRLRLTDSVSLTSFSANIDRSSSPNGSFTASVNGRSKISGNILQNKQGRTRVVITGKNTGALLRAAGLLENIKGGTIAITIDPKAEDDVYDLRFKVKTFRMISSNGITNLLDAISLIGLVQKLEGEGIAFSTAEGLAHLRPEGVRLIDVALVGPSMGLTLNGWYTAASHSVDFEGVVTPIYGLNGLFERTAGKLFGRQRGEGLFSFTYTMKGPVANPKTSVNPFSILTPGGFREIFRQKRPKAPKQ